jgi:hypothetical protein
MAAIELGRLEKVDLRSVFKTEAGAFTPWLAEEENLVELGKTIGLELELEAQEKEVGPFRADILCKNTETDGWVLIENQIEKTDHSHLGQLLTYAAGLEAVTIVWIAEHVTDQHKAALDWLNSKTTDGIDFFGLEVELWRIGKSQIAPKFNIRSQPNAFTQGVRAAANQTAAESEHRQLQLRFWTEFRKFMEESKSPVKCQKASPQHWMTHSIGKVGFHLSSVISSGKGNASGGPELRVELVVRGQKRFQAIEAFKEKIEKQLGEDLQWYNPAENISCRVFVREESDFTNVEDWPEQRAWLKETLEKFQKVFVPIIKPLDNSALKV